MPEVDVTNAEQVENCRKMLIRAYETEFQATETWGLEVTKTLFLLNAAGLTGVFALVTTGSILRSELPFMLFALGIALAVISMALGRYMHSFAATGWLDSIEKFDVAPKVSLLTLPNLKTVNLLQVLSMICAYVSGAVCIWAGLKLYLHF